MLWRNLLPLEWYPHWKLFRTIDPVMAIPEANSSQFNDSNTSLIVIGFLPSHVAYNKLWKWKLMLRLGFWLKSLHPLPWVLATCTSISWHLMNTEADLLLEATTYLCAPKQNICMHRGILTWAVHVINLWVSVPGYMHAGWLQFFYFKAPNQSHAVQQTFSV